MIIVIEINEAHNLKFFLQCVDKNKTSKIRIMTSRIEPCLVCKIKGLYSKKSKVFKSQNIKGINVIMNTHNELTIKINCCLNLALKKLGNKKIANGIITDNRVERNKPHKIPRPND